MAIGDITYGEDEIFESVCPYELNIAALDETHFAVVYQDTSGKVCIGTVSGTTITFGSVYTFHALGTAYPDITVLDSTHIAISFQGDTTNGGVIIGTVSNDDEIAFGSEVTFNATAPSYCAIAATDSTHFTIAYQDAGGGDGYGHTRSAVVSGGDTITLGDEDTFNAATTTQINIDALDSSHVAISYKDDGNTNKATSIVGVLANDDEMTFGSEVVFDNSAPSHVKVVALDSTHFITSFKDSGDGYLNSCAAVVTSGDTITYGSQYTIDTDDCYYGAAVKLNSTQFISTYWSNTSSSSLSKIGTIASDDEISFGSDYEFLAGAAYFAAVTALSTTKIVDAYGDGNNSNYGTALIGEVEAAPAPEVGGGYPSTLSLLGVG